MTETASGGPHRAVNRATISAAAERIDGRVRRTPTLRVDPTDLGLDPFELSLKLELLQVSGSFKARGATNKALVAAETGGGLPEAGLIAASGGNHGLAVASVARSLGCPAEIFVPSISSPTKRRRLAELGATVNVGGDNYQAAQDACTERSLHSGALAIHPYNDVDVLAGQGTVGLELEAQAGPLDTVLVAVGGGGLAAGVAAWLDPTVRIVTVEPDSSRCLDAALEAGAPTPVPVSGVAADSLGATQVGAEAFAVLSRRVSHSLTVPDRAIVRAQKRLWHECGCAAEPGGATAFAALLSGAYRPQRDERVAVIVCGSNVDPSTLAPVEESVP